MKLNSASRRDINMYLSNTFCLLENQPILIQKINHVVDSEVIDFQPSENYDPLPSVHIFYHYYSPQSGAILHDNIVKPINSDLPLIPVVLGFRQVDNYVVFIYKKQRNSVKKLPTQDILSTFYPQTPEFSFLDKTYDFSLNKLLLQQPEYLSIDEAFEKLKDKKTLSVPLHPYYALVKKGTNKYPVIYYRTDPVIEYNGNEFIPLIDDCHVQKFKLEVGLL